MQTHKINIMNDLKIHCGSGTDQFLSCLPSINYILFIQMFKALLVLLAVGCLTLSSSHPLRHLLTTSTQHLDTPVPAEFQAEFTAIKALVTKVNTTSAVGDSEQSKFMATKCSEITAGLDKLRETLINYGLTITTSSRRCPGVTTFNRTEIRRYITYLEVRETTAIGYLASCLNCTAIAADLHQIQNLTNNYIQHLNATLDGQYCLSSRVSNQRPTGIVNLNSSYFKSNLRAKNWYYGSTTASDYKIYLFKRASTYNLTNCPIQTPFVQDQQQVCFDCPEGSIFNLGLQKCDTCKPNEILNIKSGGCDPCRGEKRFIDGALKCQLCVLAQGQLFNETNGKCYTCGNDTYLDTQKLACIKINCSGNAPRFNRTSKQCESCGLSEIVDPHDVTRCIKTNFVALCAPATPKYNLDTKKCQVCPENTVYNDKNNECEQKNTSTQPAHLTYVSNMHLDTTATVTSVCPSDKPKYNTVTKLCEACKPNEAFIPKLARCIPKSMVCNEHQFYNPVTFQCTANYMRCQLSEYYNASTKSCLPKSNRCQGNQRYDQLRNVCEKMLLCRADEVYIAELRICERKPVYCKQQQSSDLLNPCIKIQRITSPHVANLLYLEDFNKYISSYNLQHRQNPNLRDCPLDKPYYNQHQCISCPTSQPYFDLANSICTSCPSGQAFQPSRHKCMTLNFTSVSSSISRMRI